jgi:uncharacterized protein YgbK (DUF1537 family)
MGAAGLELAEREGATVVVRCAPTFAGVLEGKLAEAYAAPPAPGRGLLVVCGSYVPGTTRQLAALVNAYPGALVEINVMELASEAPAAEIERAAAAARAALVRGRLAVVATPRERPASVATLAAGQRIAASLARAAGQAAAAADVVLAKGGITSHVTAHVGLAARSGRVVGPLVDGVALWELDVAGRTVSYVVFPGNVGSDTTLRDVVELILRGS